MKKSEQVSESASGACASKTDLIPHPSSFIPFSAVIFDMDGLMVDTEPLSHRAWAEAMAPFGIELGNEVYGRMIGHRSDVSAQIVLDAYPLPLTAVELLARKDAIYTQIRVQGVPEMPGLRELHAAIVQRDIPWAVATSSPRHHAEETLTQLGLRQSCHAIAGGDEVTHGKPAPDIYLLAAERLGVPPQRCLALEDSAPGCQAAAQAGMTTIAIPNGATETAVFPCAHHIFASLYDVIGLIGDGR